MNPEMIGILIQGVMAIVRRHYAATGVVLTDEQVRTLLTEEIREGQSDIAAWFISKGLPVPE